MSNSKLLTVKQVQDMLGISERTAFRMIKNGELKGFKVGREWRFEESDIQAYIQAQRRRAEEERQRLSEQSSDNGSLPDAA
ncbi:MAG: helix-turn-helix domain-containing protein [Ktedonobacteraceae bacterium]|nr:helix-turn-helix domain-containing protein [Ktedonobacteraceae bacterium]